MIHLDREKQIFQVEGQDEDIAMEIGDIVGAWMVKRAWDKNASFTQSKNQILYVIYQIVKELEKELSTHYDKEDATN